MEAQRKHWNEQQKELRKDLAQAALSQPGEYARTIALFLSQHAMLHASGVVFATASGVAFATASATVTDPALVTYTFEDGLWEGLSEAQARRIPPKGEHSLVWVIWHLARIEDVTMNVLVAGSPQVFQQGSWREQLKVSQEDTGNLMGSGAVASLSAAVDITALRSYRQAVGRRTRAIVPALKPDELKRKTSPARLEELRRSGAVLETAQDLLDYWGGLTVAGLLLMPPTRHNFIHLNEAWRIKDQL